MDTMDEAPNITGIKQINGFFGRLVKKMIISEILKRRSLFERLLKNKQLGEKSAKPTVQTILITFTKTTWCHNGIYLTNCNNGMCFAI
jgi:hypothetical protein